MLYPPAYGRSSSPVFSCAICHTGGPQKWFPFAAGGAYRSISDFDRSIEIEIPLAAMSIRLFFLSRLE
jgi:hypothetical protein